MHQQPNDIAAPTSAATATLSEPEADARFVGVADEDHRPFVEAITEREDELLFLIRYGRLRMLPWSDPEERAAILADPKQGMDAAAMDADQAKYCQRRRDFLAAVAQAIQTALTA